ncbi:hypothetical protein VOLCADRAFT_102754 [Volvox carteri f. nagariensis]|uniref:Uncharacterized protein n=1 Tax=Volvox carteri f. nagariensis TaxID=3068 RepID=D8THV8_VOLCA|nr:uncharacterized protein VOLCADRAFT_102754 [Volvox carteri f. nagariensis]EFJ53133.1 hypothetical protein VOLCADRAFT_102754 [Volvox carteri f. nagariensis]|eukprot:XP_002946138.1 hypothetical protein VOLCADRAFT_102754 [Volvox carteri f. nagariensis]
MVQVTELQSAIGETSPVSDNTPLNDESFTSTIDPVELGNSDSQPNGTMDVEHPNNHLEEPNPNTSIESIAPDSAESEPAYDLALLVGEGALARALEGNAEPYPQLPETDEERDAFEEEFQRAVQELAAASGSNPSSESSEAATTPQDPSPPLTA